MKFLRRMNIYGYLYIILSKFLLTFKTDFFKMYSLNTRTVDYQIDELLALIYFIKNVSD